MTLPWPSQIINEVQYFQYLSVFLIIFHYLSVFVSNFQYLSLFFSIFQYLSVFLSIYRYFSVFVSIFQYSSVFFSIVQYFSAYFSIFSNTMQNQYMTWLIAKRNYGIWPSLIFRCSNFKYIAFSYLQKRLTN